MLQDPTYAESGDAKGGFSTRIDLDTLKVKGWGFWPKEVAERFGPAVYKARDAASEIRKMEFDMTRLNPMRDEGQEGFARVMHALAQWGVQEVVVLTSSQLTKLQLLRIARENAPKGVVSFTEAREY